MSQEKFVVEESYYTKKETAYESYVHMNGILWNIQEDGGIPYSKLLLSGVRTWSNLAKISNALEINVKTIVKHLIKINRIVHQCRFTKPYVANNEKPILRSQLILE